MGFYFQDDYWDAVCELSKSQREKAIAAIVEYYFTGEEPQAKGAAKAVFLAVRDRIRLSKERKQNGGKGGKQTQAKRKANAKQNAKQNTKQTAKQTSSTSKKEREGERERDMDIPISTATAESKQPTTARSSGSSSDGWRKLYRYAIDAYNAKFQTAFTAFPAEARFGIEKAYGNGRRESDIDKVLNVAASWKSADFCTPNSVFGDKFEQWLYKPEPKQDAEEVVHGGIWG